MSFTSEKVTVSKTNTNAKPAGMTFVTPHITVSDVEKLATFYGKAPRILHYIQFK